MAEVPQINIKLLLHTLNKVKHVNKYYHHNNECIPKFLVLQGVSPGMVVSPTP